MVRAHFSCVFLFITVLCFVGLFWQDDRSLIDSWVTTLLTPTVLLLSLFFDLIHTLILILLVLFFYHSYLLSLLFSHHFLISYSLFLILYPLYLVNRQYLPSTLSHTSLLISLFLLSDPSHLR